MFWARVDNRLVHGQVIETWLPYTNAKNLLVVNNEIALDQMQQSIMSLAVPDRVKLMFITIEDLVPTLANLREENNFLLFANCEDVRRAIENGAKISSLNVGNLHYGPGKKQICSHIALSPADIRCLCFFKENGIKLDFRCVPNDNTCVEDFTV